LECRFSFWTSGELLRERRDVLRACPGLHTAQDDELDPKNGVWGAPQRFLMAVAAGFWPRRRTRWWSWRLRYAGYRHLLARGAAPAIPMCSPSPAHINTRPWSRADSFVRAEPSHCMSLGGGNTLPHNRQCAAFSFLMASAVGLALAGLRHARRRTMSRAVGKLRS
jgi:hypothetical protein